MHIVIATPGRLSDLLSKKKFNLSLCRFLALDEADRLLDAAFADELGNILDNYTVKRHYFSKNCMFTIIESKTNYHLFFHDSKEDPRVFEISADQTRSGNCRKSGFG